MDDQKKATKAQPAAPKAAAKEVLPPGMVRCRRVDAVYPVEEHLECPYCFGKRADVEKGDYAKFCDFKPGVDPISFGFPEDLGRYQSG